MSFALLTASTTSHAAEPPPYAAFYEPDSGFKPAQRNFTKIILQLAGSLEHHGTPEPYIRHVMAELERIEKKYRAATGKVASARPDYLTDHFVEGLLGNWNKMNAGLKLETLSRDAGFNVRLTIMGTWNLSPSELLSLETNFNDSERALYARLLSKQHFKKSDFPELDGFYSDGGAWDRMTEVGRAQMTRRIALAMMAPEKREAEIHNLKGGSLVVKLLNTHTDNLMRYLENGGAPQVNGDTLFATLKTGLKLDGPVPKLDGLDEYERDAFQFSHAIKWEFDQRIQYIRKKVTPASEAEATVRALSTMVDNLAVIVNSEFRAGLLEQQATKASE